MSYLKNGPEGKLAIERFKFKVMMKNATTEEIAAHLPSLLQTLSSSASYALDNDRCTHYTYNLDTGWIGSSTFDDLLRLYQRILAIRFSGLAVSDQLDDEYVNQFQLYLQSTSDNQSGQLRKGRLWNLLTLYFLAPVD
jgi:hypothetical protein